MEGAAARIDEIADDVSERADYHSCDWAIGGGDDRAWEIGEAEKSDAGH